MNLTGYQIVVVTLLWFIAQRYMSPLAQSFIVFAIISGPIFGIVGLLWHAKKAKKSERIAPRFSDAKPEHRPPPAWPFVLAIAALLIALLARFI
jgi:hypothetical protein